LIGSKDFPPLLESRESLLCSGEQFFGIKQSDELVAAISFAVYLEKIEICRLVVGSAHQRKGLGRHLVQFVLSEYATKKECIVSTASKNTPACNLYLNLNFRAVGDQLTPEGIQLTHFSRSSTN